MEIGDTGVLGRLAVEINKKDQDRVIVQVPLHVLKRVADYQSNFVVAE